MSSGYFTVQTTFYERPKLTSQPREECQINLAKYPRSAVLRAVDHMQTNRYGADFCEVFDTNTNESHARIWLRMDGRIEIEYGRDSTLYVLGGPPLRRTP